MGSMGKRRGRRTRSAERGGRANIDRGIHLSSPTPSDPLTPTGFLQGFAAFNEASSRLPNERRWRLYRGTLPFILLGGFGVLVVLGVIFALARLA